MYFSTILPAVLLLTSIALAVPVFEPKVIEQDINGTDSLEARDKFVNRDAGITMYAYGAVKCGGVKSIVPITYNIQNTGMFRSYSLSRDMVDGEVFDFSTGTGLAYNSIGFGGQKKVKRDYIQPGSDFDVPSLCDTFADTAKPLTKGKNCYTLKKDMNAHVFGIVEFSGSIRKLMAATKASGKSWRLCI